mgnify:CR=1 FL=1
MFQVSGALYAQNEIAWTPWLRTLAGIRGDSYRFNVEASDPRNSGTKSAGIVSPKGGAVFGPWKGTELYLNAGLGFHGNDARGTTMTVVPGTNDHGGSSHSTRPRERRRRWVPDGRHPAAPDDVHGVGLEFGFGTAVRR